MSWSYVIVLDQGTHSTRAILYDHLGDSIFKSQKNIDLFYHDSSKVEQSGDQILHSCIAVLSDAHEYINDQQLENIAVALTTQRSTVIAWDKSTGEAISPALSWLDTRASHILESLELDERIVKNKTGLPLSPHYGASKLQWMLGNDSGVKHKKQEEQLSIGPLAAYLIFNLVESQPNYIDYSNAHRTLLWNLQTKTWDEDLLSAFNIDALHLPHPVPSCYDYGVVKQLGCPLVLVNGDQNSAVYGYGRLAPNTAFINIGTGAFILANSKKKPILSNTLLSSITYSSENEEDFVLEGTVNGAGAAMSWAESEWKMDNIETIEWQDVGDVPIFINTIGGLGSPFWRSDISPRFLQAQKKYKDFSKQQCMAALMESIAFLITINIEEMQKHEIKIDQILVAGGMSKDKYLCQCLADLSGVTILVSSFKEATSRGAAWLVMQKPNWSILESEQYFANENNSLLTRYVKFRSELKRILY